MIKHFLAALYFTFFLAITQIGAGKSYASDSKNPIVKTVDGKDFDIEALRGKVVIVTFWAYWCPNCTREMKILEVIHTIYRHKGVEVVGINVDRRRDIDHILKKAKLVSYPNIMRADSHFDNLPEIDAIPATFIFDQYGKLIGKDIVSLERYETFLDEFLLKKDKK